MVQRLFVTLKTTTENYQIKTHLGYGLLSVPYSARVLQNCAVVGMACLALAAAPNESDLARLATMVLSPNAHRVTDQCSKCGPRQPRLIAACPAGGRADIGGEKLANKASDLLGHG